MLNVRVALVGPGAIGSAFLKQLADSVEKGLGTTLKATIKLVAVANSTTMLTCSSADLLTEWKERLKLGEPADLHRFVAALGDSQGNSCSVLIDCTASDAAPSVYLEAMRAGCHIITPNKKFGSGPVPRYQELKELSSSCSRSFLYEATVGAGLPVLTTLRDLLDTGDEVTSVEGVLSGTLSHIFNTYTSDMRLSDVVAEARKMGYTEPDPREDLSGMDVARKAVILARECGMTWVELDSMDVESLVPDALVSLPTADEFMAGLPAFDGLMSARTALHEEKGEVLRYVASVDVEKQTCSVRLASYAKSHPFAQLSGTDNMVVFKTKRYHTRPLVICGPGAGAEVTAMGVFADLLRIIRTHKAM